MKLNFSQPDGFLSGLEPETVGAIIAASTDLTLFIDEDDAVRDMSCTIPQVSNADFKAWLNKPIEELVAADGRADLRRSMASARSGEGVGHCQLAHSLRNGETLAVKYSACAVGTNNELVLLGSAVPSLESLRKGMATILQKMNHAAEQPRQTRPENSSLPQMLPKDPRTTEHLTAQVGSVPLKELVRDTTDLIEKDCIAAALQLTGNNRALASRVLGLSRQSLYIKMRRYDLVDDTPE